MRAQPVFILLVVDEWADMPYFRLVTADGSHADNDTKDKAR